VVIHSAASDFSLPIRVAPGQTEISQSSDIYNAEVQNSAEAKEGFMTSIVNKYSANRLGSTIWQCKICGKKATDIIHAATSTLSPLGSSTSDAVVPVCNSMNCVTQGRAMAEGLGRNESSSLEAMTCENCGNPSKMVLCAACRFTREWISDVTWVNKFLICITRCSSEKLLRQN
jgi:hypothetical protein